MKHLWLRRYQLKYKSFLKLGSRLKKALASGLPWQTRSVRKRLKSLMRMRGQLSRMQVQLKTAGLGMGLGLALMAGEARGQEFVSEYANVPVPKIQAQALVDIDGDGDLDLFGVSPVTTSGTNPTNKIYFQENLGGTDLPTLGTSITKHPFGISDLGYATHKIAFADIDNDGDYDAFVGGKYGRTRFFENTGNATSPSFTLNGDTSPLGLADVGNNAEPTIVDIDGDGDSDFFIRNQNGAIAYFENTGGSTNPNFVEQTTSPIGDITAPYMQFIDMDGDDDVDLVTNSSDRFVYWENTGNASLASFELRSNSPFSNIPFSNKSFAVGDLSGDNYNDLAILGYYYRGDSENGTSTFNLPNHNPFGLEQRGHSIDFADIDNDGDFDGFFGARCYSNCNAELFFQENIGDSENASFALSTLNSFGINTNLPDSLGFEPSIFYTKLADIDADGDLDLFFIVSNGDLYGSTRRVGYYENIGNKSTPEFAQPIISPSNLNIIVSSQQANLFSLVDLDADGDLDVMTAGAYGYIAYYENTGNEKEIVLENAPLTGISNMRSLIQNPVFNTYISFTDIDNDGDYDLFVTLPNNYGDRGLGFFENIGTPNLPDFNSTLIEYPFGIEVPQGTNPIAFQDFDNDGDNDVLLRQTAGIRYYENIQNPTKTRISGPSHTNTATTSLSVAFDTPVTGFELSDFELSNGSASNLQSVDNTVFTVDVEVVGGDTVLVNIPAASVKDAKGSNNIASNAFELVYDITPPQASLASNSSVNSDFTALVDFHEPMKGVEMADFSISNGSITDVATSDSIVFRVSISPEAEGNISLGFAAGNAIDLAGNSNLGSDFSITYDTTPPTATLSTSATSPTNQPSIPVSLAFSEQMRGLSAQSLAVTNGRVDSFTLNADSTGAEAIIAPTVDEGTVSIGLASVSDLAGNSPEVPPNTLEIVYDGIAPTVSISSDVPSITDREQVEANIIFSEAVTGFDKADLILSNTGIASMTTEDSMVFSLVITPIAQAGVSVSIPAGGAFDRVSNPNTASNSLSFDYFPNSNRISGRVYEDVDGDCSYTAGTDMPWAGYTVRAVPSGYFAISKSDGTYELLVDEGNYTVEVVLPELQGSLIRQNCSSAYSVSFSGFENVQTDFDFAQEVTECHILSVDVATDRRRRCFENYTVLSYRNEGFSTAENAQVSLRLPEFVDFISANVAHTLTADSVYVFEVGMLAPGQSGVIYVTDIVRCEDNIVGLDQCTEAWILPGNACLEANNPPSADWDGSSIAVEGICVSEDTGSQFIIRNIGAGDMSEPSTYRLYEDTELASSDNFQLASGDSLVIAYKPYGGSVRVEADQSKGHAGRSLPQATVQGCKRNIANRTSSANAFEQDDAAPEISVECLPIIDSYDPNDKMATPQGVTENRYVRPETPLDYRIRFQNTGTDTAYTVVVVDTLSPLMDISTLRFGASSHPYELTMTGEESPVLTFTFNDIDLVDSLTDEPNSHGFIKFSIAPVEGHPEGTIVHNLADIYFDFNEPIRTNDAWVNYSTYVPEQDGYEFGQDLDLPKATLSAPAAFVNAPFDLDISVNEEASLTVAAINADNATLSNFQGSGSRYMVTVNPSAEGEVSIALPEGAFADLAGNPSLASNTASVVYDITAPTAAVSFTANFETLAPFTAELVFSEPTVGEVELADFEVSGGTALGVSGEGGTYTLTVQPDAIGSISVALKAGAVEDRAGNPNARIQEVVEVTAFADNQLSAFTKLYPNPTTGQVQVEFAWAGAGSKQVRLFNSLGQEVLSTATTSTESQLNLAKLPAGTYMLQITADKGVAVKMVVRE